VKTISDTGFFISVQYFFATVCSLTDCSSGIHRCVDSLFQQLSLKDEQMKTSILFSTFAGLALASSAMAASPDYMMEDCRNNSRIFFQDFEARSDTSYEGQRTDGTHAVNGTIYLENRSENFQCSFNANGDTMVDFYAQGKSWPGFVKGEGSPHMAGKSGSSGTPASTTAAKVEFAPGTSSSTLAGAVRGHEFFDYSLRASEGQMMHVDLRVRDTNGDGTIYFNILPPGSTGEAIFIGSRDGISAKTRLPRSGEYVIRVYLMGNDRDSDKIVGYDLDVSIR
jgi:hypothetical protein